MTDDEMTICK